METQAETLQSMNAWLKAAAVWAAMVAAGWIFHAYQNGGDARPALHDPSAALKRDRSTARDEGRRGASEASGEARSIFGGASYEERQEVSRWKQAFPRNDAECRKMTLGNSVWEMRQHGCLYGAAEYPPAVLERGETVLLDNALKAANRRPTQVGEVGDKPRNVEFCDAATTHTPRIELWRNGCLLWGVEPRIPSDPERPLDEALRASGIEPTKPGPLPAQVERDDAFCAGARNTTNPVQLWRYGCLPRGTFAPFIEPEMRLDEALREALPAGESENDSAA